MRHSRLVEEVSVVVDEVAVEEGEAVDVEAALQGRRMSQARQTLSDAKRRTRAAVQIIIAAINELERWHAVGFPGDEYSGFAIEKTIATSAAKSIPNAYLPRNHLWMRQHILTFRQN